MNGSQDLPGVKTVSVFFFVVCFFILFYILFEQWTYVAVLSAGKGTMFLSEQIVLTVIVHDFLNIWPTVLLISIPAAKSSQRVLVTKWNTILTDLPGELCAFWQCQRDEAGTDFNKKKKKKLRQRTKEEEMLPYGTEGLI